MNVLGFRKKYIFTEVINKINLNSLDGADFWIIFAPFLRENRNISVETTRAISFLKRVDKVYRGGTS